MRRYLLLMVLVCCLASCGQASTEDVSGSPKFSSVIGSKFRTKTELWAIGVTADDDYAKQVDYVVLVSGVGFSGPEVVSKTRVPEGFTFKVVKVKRTSFPVFGRVDYIVEDTGSERFHGVEVRLRVTGQADDGNGGLDRANFDLIEKK